MTPPRPSPEAAPADARRAAATRTAGGGLVCAAVALVLVGSGLWPTVAGVVLAAAGIGLGITALVRSRGTDQRRLLVVSAVAAIVLGTLSLLTGGARLALWPVAEAYQECVAGTLTLSGAAQCQQELEDGIWSYLSGGPAAPASDAAAGASTASTSNASAGPGSATARP
ncbi:hypothetical protein [uncultured Kocuria sp.]|uniref:hypothetical protein n=1 Tax=uncultured Kocuria sp. TaxID=259305 RepID=UPI00262DD8CB|nr:hypothetical protein [uncultured Kocuria sp.]